MKTELRNAGIAITKLALMLVILNAVVWLHSGASAQGRTKSQMDAKTSDPVIMPPASSSLGTSAPIEWGPHSQDVIMQRAPSFTVNAAPTYAPVGRWLYCRKVIQLPGKPVRRYGCKYCERTADGQKCSPIKSGSYNKIKSQWEKRTAAPLATGQADAEPIKPQKVTYGNTKFDPERHREIKSSSEFGWSSSSNQEPYTHTLTLKPAQPLPAKVVFTNYADGSFKNVGSIEFRGGPWHFDGDMDASAKLFLKYINSFIVSPCNNIQKEEK